ncbi:MAG: outer membrane protein assembly factor BamD [Flavobacteriales bacterium]|nr:outer membrane protein assembly factor BamD [Flavobacteriales bacterium]
MKIHHWFLLLFGVLVASCGEFNRAAKSNNPAYKLQVAEKYFALAEKQVPDSASRRAKRKQRRKATSAYERSLPLLEELIALTRGDTTFERVSYMHAKSYYGIKDYILAGYYLENFSKTFPTSRYAEECAFLSAMCQYRESPIHELDQQSTRTAIDQLQLFLSTYPETQLKDSCNNLIDRLRGKLETKDHANSMLYVKTRNYEAADIALRNFLSRWPNSAHREEVLFNILLMDHDLAMNSVDAKKALRIEAGLRSFDTFADAFPESPRLKEAKRLRDDLTELTERLKRTQNP